MRLAAWDEPAVRGVGAVGERLRHGGQPGGLGAAQQFGLRQPQQRQCRVVPADRLHHRVGLLGVRGHRVVQRTVRLDVAHRGAGDPGEPVERGDLVDDVVGEVVRIHVDEAAPEPGQVAIAHLGPDRHPALGGPLGDPPQHRRVPRVEPAGDVRAAHDVQQRLVVAQRPGTEALAQVAVEIDRHVVHTPQPTAPARGDGGSSHHRSRGRLSLSSSRTVPVTPSEPPAAQRHGRRRDRPVPRGTPVPAPGAATSPGMAAIPYRSCEPGGVRGSHRAMPPNVDLRRPRAQFLQCTLGRLP